MTELFFFLEHFTVTPGLVWSSVITKKLFDWQAYFFMTTFKGFIRLCMDTAANIHQLNESHREQN